MGALTLKDCERIVRDELGADPGGSVELREHVNRAGTLLMNSRQWSWAGGRSVVVRLRARIVGEGATWTEATRTLTLTGAFADYSWLSADTVDIADGTGATVGTYEVEEHVDDDSVILRTSIGAAADGQTDIDFELPNDQVMLPTDFDLMQIEASNCPPNMVIPPQFTTPDGMLSLRSWGTAGNSCGFWLLLRHVRTTSGGQPVPRLEVWPKSDTAEQSFTIFYRGGWHEPATDSEVLTIPGWLNDVYIELLKAVVMGHEEPENGSVMARVDAVKASTIWLDAVLRDGAAQPEHGAYRNGWLDGGGSFSRFDLPAPTIQT